MTEEISIRSSRARRGADVGDPPMAGSSPSQADPVGEAAWRLADKAGPSQATGGTGESPPAVPFPPFPGLGVPEEEEPSGPGLDVRRYLQGVWERRWLAWGCRGPVLRTWGPRHLSQGLEHS